MNKLAQLKIKYNELIKTTKRLEEYFDKVSSKEGEKKLPEFKVVLENITRTLEELEQLGCIFTKEEALEGFKES